MALPKDFDYGADVTEGSGTVRVNPETGLHFSRLKSLIHLGCVEREYKGTKKEPSNKVVAVFELKGGEDGVDDLHPETGEPLTISIAFNLIKGDNSFMNSKLLPALVSKKEAEAGTIKGFDDLIGRPCQLNLEGSKALTEDGKHKYVDIKAMSAVMSMVASTIPPLTHAGVGHCRLSQLSLAALDEINMYIDVQEGIMKSVEWAAGTHPAIALVEEIRKEQPNYAKSKPADASAADSSTKPSPAQTEKLTKDEEF